MSDITATATSPAPAPAEFLGHPRALYVLFFAELWERFSYYGMRALLVFYLTKHFLFSDEAAYGLYGAYTSLVYAMPVIGGLLADRWLGARKAVTFGALLLVAGHFLMAFEGTPAERLADGSVVRSGLHEQVLYLALALIIIGVGFLKANISTMVGKLYATDDPRRDGAFTIFYMGINVGAMVAALVCGWLGETLGWGWGFGAAGAGMLLGLVVFLRGQPLLMGYAEPPDPRALASRVGGLSLEHLIYLGGLAAVLATWQLVQAEVVVGWFLLLVSAVAVIGLITWTLAECTTEERDRMLVMLVLIASSVLFWALFEQSGTSMNLFADRNVDREVLGVSVAASQFQSLNPFFIILLAPLFAVLWPWLAKLGWEPSTPVKFGLGIMQAGLGFACLVQGAALAGEDGQVAVLWLVLAYLFHTTGELCLSPVGLSMVTRLAVPRVVGMVMGVWFLSSAGAAYVGGLIAQATGMDPEAGGDGLSTYASVFGDLAWVAVVAGLVLIALTPLLKRGLHGLH